MAQPYINLYIGDLLKDTDCLSPCAFGGYIKLLFKMHLSNEKGKVAYSMAQLSRVIGCDIDQAQVILNELVELNICDYECVDGKHVFMNRRMIKEAKISKKRSEYGKKGMANRYNKDATDSKDFVITNEITKEQQNTGIGIGNGNDNNEGVVGETKSELEESLTTTGQAYLVPAMLNVWRTTDPSYPIDRDRDFKPLQEIAEFLAKQNNVQVRAGTGIDTDSFLSVVETWKALAPFIAKHKLFKSYSLQQMSRHIQSIIQAYKQNENDSTSTNNGRKEWHGKGASISEIQAHKYKPGTVLKDEVELCGAENCSLADDWE